jgi:hypothetical protein
MSDQENSPLDHRSKRFRHDMGDLDQGGCRMRTAAQLRAVQLVAGHEIDASVASDVTHHPAIVTVGDALPFPGAPASQT